MANYSQSDNQPLSNNTMKVPEHYRTNNIDELKRAAIKQLDRHLLEKIKEYDQVNKDLFQNLLFWKPSEVNLRDLNGKIFDMANFRDGNIFIFDPESTKNILESKWEQPEGHLYNSIITFDKNNEENCVTNREWIFELPEETEFPLERIEIPKETERKPDQTIVEIKTTDPEKSLFIYWDSLGRRYISRAKPSDYELFGAQRPW
tara:strand:- start:582 stop:1193 length:612 start_codon:yes stop_codon:yes gene_type:complete